MTTTTPKIAVRETVLRVFQEVAKQGNRVLRSPLTDAILLTDSGLDSFCIATIIFRLDIELRLDPFGTMENPMIPDTVGDFVSLYELAADTPLG